MDTNDTPGREEPTQPTQPIDPPFPPRSALPADAQPTEPFGPLQPEGAATALQAQAAPQAQADSASFLRRHAVGVGITAAALAVVLVAGGTAWGVSAAVAGTQTAAAPMTAPNAAGGTGTKAVRQGDRKAHGAVGTITAKSGDTWTLHAASGATLTVKLAAGTAFGTKKSPSTESSFAVGDKVGVLGARTDTTVTASRIVHLPLGARTATPAPSATASGSATA